MYCPYCGYAVLNPALDVKQCSRLDDPHVFTVDRAGIATRVEAPAAPVVEAPPAAVEAVEEKQEVEAPKTVEPPAAPAPASEEKQQPKQQHKR